MPLDRPGEVGHFVGVIGEGIGAGPLLELEFRFVGRDVLERDLVLDREAPGLAGKVGDGDAIVENVVDPAKPVRTGLDVEACVQQPLVVAVARTQHHPMLAKPHRGGVGVGREMPYCQDGHARSDRRSVCSTIRPRPR